MLHTHEVLGSSPSFPTNIGALRGCINSRADVELLFLREYLGMVNYAGTACVGGVLRQDTSRCQNQVYHRDEEEACLPEDWW